MKEILGPNTANERKKASKEGSKRQVVVGMFWSGIQLIVNQGFSFIVKIVLAKLLFPEQFGLVGMATVFIGFIQILNNLGIGAALIQRKDEELKETHFYTAFWTGIVWSLIVYLIVSFLVGPLAAVFYNQQILTSIVPVLSIGILVSPINFIHKALLTRKMDFKRIAVIANSSVVLSGFISILLAYLGVGIWALVFNSVGSLVFQAPLFFKITGWKPKWYWNKQEFNEIFSFGIFTTGTNVMNYWMQNLDYLLIGKIFNASTLGVYTLAFILTDTFRMKLMSVINTVMYPMFSKRQDDIKSVSRYYFKVIFFNCVISFPIMTFLIVLGEPFVLHVFGTKWADSVIPLQLLAFSVMFHMMISGNNVLIRGMGKPNLEFKVQIVKAIIYIPMLIFGTYKYGVIGAASVVLINKVIGVFIAHHALKLVLNDKIKFSYFLKIVSPPIFASLISGLLVYWLFLNELSYIFCGILLFISYGLMIYFIRKQEVLELKKELLKL